MKREKMIYFKCGLNTKVRGVSFLKSISKIKIPLIDKNDMEGPNFLLNFHNVTKLFKDLDNEKLIVKNFNFKLMKNEKNWCNRQKWSRKVYIFNVASGIIKPNEGSIKIRNNIQFSCFQQNGQNFNDNYSIKKFNTFWW